MKEGKEEEGKRRRIVCWPPASDGNLARGAVVELTQQGGVPFSQDCSGC